MNLLAFDIAKRYYKASYQNRYIRFINRASSIGISLGVLALIVGLSIMNGFEKELKSTLLAVIPDVEFEAVEGKIENWTIAQTTLSKLTNVIGAAPYIKTNAMLQKKNTLEAVLIHGVEPELEKSVNSMYQFILEGRWLSESPGVVIGSGLAGKMSLSIGDNIELLVPKTLSNGKLATPKYVKLPLVGIYQIGGQMDYGQVFMPLSKLQQLFDWQETQAEGIKVALTDPFDARTLGRQLGRELDEYVYVLDWFRTNGHIYNDIVMVKDIMYLVMVLVMAVACFNIVSSLTMAVQEKHSDIGILKTMGLKPNVVKHVFVIMGMITAVKGIVWGVIIGVLFAINLPDFFNLIEQLLGFKALDSDVYFISHIPSVVEYSQVAIIVLTALVISFLASYFPAKKAAQMQPVELISG